MAVYVLLKTSGRTGPCTHEYTAVAVYRQTGHTVGEALVRKKKESRRSGGKGRVRVGERELGGDHK